MSRLDIVLLVLLMGSCLYLVRTSHEARQLYSELDKQRSEASDLHAEYEQLETERRAQSAPARVEKLARERLRMVNATPAITQYVASTLPAPLSAASMSESVVSGTRPTLESPSATTQP